MAIVRFLFYVPSAGSKAEADGLSSANFGLARSDGSLSLSISPGILVRGRAATEQGSRGPLGYYFSSTHELALGVALALTPPTAAMIYAIQHLSLFRHVLLRPLRPS